MIQLLMSPRAARNIRGILGTVADAVRSVVAPSALVADQAATVEPVEAPDPADTYTADEMPELVVVERAALGYDLAADNARRADRAKRAARKILDRLPSGTYGAWVVERVASNRQTADLDKIRAIFKANGLGPVPMKTNAPSLRVTRAELGAPADDTAVLAAV
ncbi:hypothetical protein QBA35_28830 [Streptomyces bottropensis]|uniref:Uncharacterized protein n=1 Tax=Streptomyces bottropensis TaxID=42235 RepID=A0ABU8AU98_9ACTN